MTDWDALARECDAWAVAGRQATWWWRDDDAVAPTPALETLIALEPDAVALAVIPERMRPELGGFFRDHPGVTALQHGFAHINHARADERKSELPDSRDRDATWSDLAEGTRLLKAALGIQALPVLTPPWNRAGDAVLAGLRGLGFSGLSRYLPRRQPQIHGLKQVNTHVDVIDWKGNRGFIGESAALGLLVGHFEARRLGKADGDEPTGLLTHHLVHDPATWQFLEKLRDFLKKQTAARLLDPAAVLQQGPFRNARTMVELRYPLSALAYDYLRGLIGLGIAVLILSTIGNDTPVFWVIVGLAVLFLVWLANTFLRHMSRIRFDQDGLSSEPWPKKAIAWKNLEEMALRYYSTRRKRKDGWMTLTLRSGKQRIDIESTLPHFADIVARAAHAAKEAHVSLDQITVENLSAIGVKGEA